MPETSSTTAASSFFWREMRSRPFLIAAFLLVGLGAAILEMAGVALVFPLLMLIANPESLARVPLLNGLAEVFGAADRRALGVIIVALITAIMVAKNLYLIAFQRWQARVLSDWKARISNRLMRIYLFADFEIHLQKTSSEIIRNIAAASQVVDLYIMPSFNILVSATTALGLVIVLFATLPGETAFAVGFLLVTGTTVYFVLRSAFLRLGKASNELFQERQKLLREAIGAIKEAKILGKEGYFVEQFLCTEKEHYSKLAFTSFLSGLPALVFEIAIIASAVVLILFELVLKDNPAGLATLGLLVATMFRLAPMCNRVLSSLHLMNLGRDATGIIATEIDCYEKNLYLPAPNLGRLPSWQTLRFTGVGYSYPNSERKLAIDNLSFAIERNEFVGITGASGSGKSTLMMVILGLLRATHGAVSIDDMRLDDPDTVRRWQNGIGYVPQGLFVTEGTVLDNIAYGEKVGQADAARAGQLIDLVQLTEHVNGQPKGLLESVGESGSKLSGGQKQRLVIARALWNDPDVLAFDEATSALDVELERGITANLLKFKSKKTMVAIAHRLSTLLSCDKILFMDKGRLVDFGTFQELERRCPQFRKLVELSALKGESPASDPSPPKYRSAA